MISSDLIEARFRDLDRYMAQLRYLASEDARAFCEDPIKVGAAKYYLQVAIESCLDVAHHLIAREGWRAPTSYADTFTVLAEQHVIPQSFLPTAQKMARMRNRLVHLYWEVDEEALFQILHQHLDDFEHFKGFVYQYLRKHT